jgi:UDP-N-acetylmuramate--alanine ligase
MQIPEKVHFIGIGGISMSGLAHILLAGGTRVTGSDDKHSENTAALEAAGIPVSVPTAAANLPADAGLVVYTAAIRQGNAERDAAEAAGIPMVDRAQLIGMLLQSYASTICIAGTHGKTTTTGMLAQVLLATGVDPTISVGGHMRVIDSNFRVGGKSHFLLEACEYSGSFLHWQPTIGVILNIEADHLDFFGSIEKVHAAFAGFAANIRPEGIFIVHESIPKSVQTACVNCTHTIYFGENCTTGFHARNAQFSPLGSTFDVYNGDAHVAHTTLPAPGSYNIENALAVFAVAHALRLPPTETAAALSQFNGMRRRYEHKGTTRGIEIIDDYAHHPTEIKKCLQATRAGREKGSIVAVFQPHTYTRTRNHFEDFAAAFADADTIIFTPIFAAREAHDPTITSEMLAEAAKQQGKHAIYAKDFHTACSVLQEILAPGDVLLTIGAGDVHKVGEMMLV